MQPNAKASKAQGRAGWQGKGNAAISKAVRRGEPGNHLPTTHGKNHELGLYLSEPPSPLPRLPRDLALTTSANLGGWREARVSALPRFAPGLERKHPTPSSALLQSPRKGGVNSKAFSPVLDWRNLWTGN